MESMVLVDSAMVDWGVEAGVTEVAEVPRRVQPPVRVKAALASGAVTEAAGKFCCGLVPFTKKIDLNKL
jgi:hypothetical protein